MRASFLSFCGVLFNPDCGVSHSSCVVNYVGRRYSKRHAMQTKIRRIGVRGGKQRTFRHSVSLRQDLAEKWLAQQTGGLRTSLEGYSCPSWMCGACGQEENDADTPREHMCYRDKADRRVCLFCNSDFSQTRYYDGHFNSSATCLDLRQRIVNMLKGAASPTSSSNGAPNTDNELSDNDK